jgi:formylglycine-generating enzyme required for sulfatase activity
MVSGATIDPAAKPGAVVCPRCGAAIGGDYKFCPACAFRLRSGEAPAPDAERKGRRRSAFLGATIAIAAISAAILGLVLFHPGWFRSEPDPSASREPASSNYFAPAITVAQIPENLVEIPSGFAFEASLDALPASYQQVWDDVRARHPEIERLAAYTWYPMRVSRYEVTRGQYEECLRDVLAHPDHLPPAWRRELDEHAAPLADLVLAHTPTSWRQTASDGTSTWSLPELDRNLPVVEVSCLDAQSFCQWASARLGIRIRLPVAMEWVRAARGGMQKYLWPWGESPLVYACNNVDSSYGRPLWVHFRYGEPPGAGGGGATPEGLFAMAGNVAEWALDHELVPQMTGPGPALLNPHPPTLGWVPFPLDRAPTTALAYGGSFRTGIRDCQVDVYRRYEASDASRGDVGFRVVHIPEPDDGK